jgi:TonB family protein
VAERSGNCLTQWADLQWQGWLASVALHAAIVTLVLIAPVNKVIDATTLFQWDVRLVEQEFPVPQTIEAGEAGNGSSDKPSRELQDEPKPQPVASVKTVNRPNTSVPRPVETARPVQRQAQLRKIVTREELPVQEIATQSANRQVIEAESSAMVTEPVRSEPVTKDSVEHSAIERSEERRQYEMKRPEVRDVHMTDQQPSLLETVSAETAAVVGPGIVQHQGALTRPDAVPGSSAETRPSSVVKPAVPPHGGDGGDGKRSGQATSLRKSEILEEASAQPAEVAGSGQVSQATASSEARIENPGPMVSASVSGSGKGAGPDYGWLKRLLWERINHIKSYSDDAVENEWEGRVVMVVTIRADGRIDDVNVAESSGNGLLDREAAALIARVTPLELDRALGAERVKLRVPISFGLE